MSYDLAQLEVWAQENKHKATAAELALLEPLTELGFLFQYPLMFKSARGKVWRAIADFYHPKHKVIVEVDGSSHRKKKGRDARRDRAADYNDLRTIRVTNKEALKGTALEKIKQFLSNGRGEIG